MTIATIPNMPFTNNIMSVDATFLNHVRTSLPKCADAVGGGTYNPLVPLAFGGAGLKLNVNGGSGRLAYSEREITRVQKSLLFNNDTGTWKVSSITIGPPTEQGIQDLERIPNGATLTSVTAYHNPANASPPAGTKTSLQVFKIDITTGIATQIGTTTVDPTTGASYGDYHGFSVSGLSEVIDRTKNNYYAIFNGESGSGSADSEWYGCQCTFVVTDQDEAP